MVISETAPHWLQMMRMVASSPSKTFKTVSLIFSPFFPLVVFSPRHIHMWSGWIEKLVLTSGLHTQPQPGNSVPAAFFRDATGEAAWSLVSGLRFFCWRLPLSVARVVRGQDGSSNMRHGGRRREWGVVQR